MKTMLHDVYLDKQLLELALLFRVMFFHEACPFLISKSHAKDRLYSIHPIKTAEEFLILCEYFYDGKGKLKKVSTKSVVKLLKLSFK